VNQQQLSVADLHQQMLASSTLIYRWSNKIAN